MIQKDYVKKCGVLKNMTLSNLLNPAGCYFNCVGVCLIHMIQKDYVK